MDKIKLADGREFDALSFGISHAGYLFIRVQMSMGEAAEAFSHGTDRIIYEPDGGGPKAISGFTKLEYIVNEDSCVRVAITRPMEFEDIF